ncbi:hypothetical protein SNE40_013691 [Patella caerulea]|uniref:F5/8 type C domain-containing protein n=1 Tax=Patella caerulea TaxID=87958 RepID=A0AAN8JC36_PATCE
MGKESDLFKAVKEGDIVKLQKLIQSDRRTSLKKGGDGGKGLDVNSIDKETGYTPLITATLAGNRKLVEYLIVSGANVNIPDIKGNTPLHLAVFSGSVELIDIFLQRSNKRITQNKDGNTPLHIACQSDLENKLFVINRLLHADARQLNIRNKDELTPLDVAAMFNKKDAVSILLDFDEKRTNNTHAIVAAAIRGNNDVVELLLNYGISPNSISEISGSGPMHEAVRFYRIKVFEVLLKFGGSPKLKNSLGEVPENMIKDLPLPTARKFAQLIKDLSSAPPQIPKFTNLSQMQNISKDISINYPVLPCNKLWTENSEMYCSSCTEKNPNTHAIDDNHQTFWVIPEVHHAWTVLDLQYDHMITGITIYGWNSPQMVKTFQLQTSDNIQGPWMTFFSGQCVQSGSEDPKVDGTPQTFSEFSVKTRYLRFYILDNHGGKSICFQGLQLYGVDCRVIETFLKLGFAQYSDSFINKGYNNYSKMLELTMEDIREVIHEEMDNLCLYATIQEFRKKEYKVNKISWLREPAMSGVTNQPLPAFSVQCDPMASSQVCVKVIGDEVIKGVTSVNLVPSTLHEASVAIFDNITITKAGSWQILVYSVENTDVHILAPNVITIKAGGRPSSEIEAQFDDIQRMLFEMQASLK